MVFFLDRLLYIKCSCKMFRSLFLLISNFFWLLLFLACILFHYVIFSISSSFHDVTYIPFRRLISLWYTFTSFVALCCNSSKASHLFLGCPCHTYAFIQLGHPLCTVNTPIVSWCCLTAFLPVLITSSLLLVGFLDWSLDCEPCLLSDWLNGLWPRVHLTCEFASIQ